MSTPEPMTRLVVSLSKLPGVGRRSAERMALRIIRDSGALIPDLIAALQHVKDTVCPCERCGSVTLRAQNPCRLCTDSARDGRTLCVVENPDDITMIEASGAYRGRYHALPGRLSPMRGEGPGQLRVDALVRRVREEQITEVILALDADVEGDATSAYLQHALEQTDARVSRLARGIPSGSAVAYTDPLTLARALSGRQEV